MKRAIIQLNGKYVKWIQWTAGVTPYIPEQYFSDNPNEAMVVSNEYLNYELGRTTKTARKDLLVGKYPDVKFLEVELVVKGELDDDAIHDSAQAEVHEPSTDSVGNEEDEGEILKYKAEISGAGCVMENIYRKTMDSAIKSARNALDKEKYVQRYPNNHKNIVISIFEGRLQDTPAFIKKQSIIYSKLAKEVPYKEE